MTISLTAEQERRVRAVISRGAYGTVDELMDAALAAVEQRIVPGFTGSEEELEVLLEEGLASTELTEQAFWDRLDRETDALLHKKRANTRA